MFTIESFQKTGENFFNYHAIDLLERIGIQDPPEEKIQVTEVVLQQLWEQCRRQ